MGTRKLLGVMDILTLIITLSSLVVVCYVKTYQTRYFKYVQLNEYQLWFSKALKKIPENKNNNNTAYSNLYSAYYIPHTVSLKMV